jgi:multidrug efflux pump subunit AcrB
VWLDGQKLYAYGLNVDQVRNAIASQNVEIPEDAWTRAGASSTCAPWAASNGRGFQPPDCGHGRREPVRLGDIATVEDGVEEPNRWRGWTGLSRSAGGAEAVRTNTLDGFTL